jgi:hypothetical protein
MARLSGGERSILSHLIDTYPAASPLAVVGDSPPLL